MIRKESIESLKNYLDIVDVISQFLELKKSGANFKACCPFHGEDTPSFVVSPSKQIYHCFGCGVGGDSIKFLMEYEKLSYPETIEKLASMYNYTLEYDTNSVKTFDNQQVQYSNRYGTDILENNQFFKDKKLKVFTDMYKGESYVSDTGTFVTDREGSVCYPIPRAGDDKNTSTDVYINGYGRRMRGRWMVETYTDLEPSKKSSIYNIITKTRKSYN